ncbi:MAG: hypothetical protein ACI4HN_02395, partial [Ruminococcus sp.]
NPVFFYCLKDYYLHKILWTAEDSELADMIYYYLIEQGTDKYYDVDLAEFKRIMTRACEEVLDGVY